MHYLIFLHGIGSGSNQKDYESMFKIISNKLPQDKKDNLKKIGIYWNDVVEQVEEDIFDSMFDKKGNKNFALLQLIKVIPKLREFLTFWVGDSIAYTAENDNGIRSKVWRTLSTEILKMQPDDKYSIIAHSLGSVIAFDYLFKLFIKDTLLHPGEFPETDSKILDNYKNKFCHFFTMGSPISLFLLRQGKLYQKKSGNFLIQKETKNFDNLISPVLIDKNLPIEFNRTWFNFCDTEDIISFPLNNIFDRNKDNKVGEFYPKDTILPKDVFVETGDVVIDSHENYWVSDEVTDLIVKSLFNYI